MKSYRLTERAEGQIAAIMAWSEDQYGPAHASRYETLVLAAIDDVVADPRRLGATCVSRSAGIWAYALRHSRNRVRREERIRDPWHKVIYRPLPDGIVEILAVVGLSYPSGRAVREAIRVG